MTLRKRLIAGLALLGCLLAPASRAATAEDYYRAGLDLYQKAQYADSVKYFDAAVQTDPAHWKSFQVKGQALYFLGKKPEALEACDASLKIHPDNPALKAFGDRIRSEIASGVTAPAAPQAETAETMKARRERVLENLRETSAESEWEFHLGPSLPVGGTAGTHQGGLCIGSSYGTKFARRFALLGEIEYNGFKTINPVLLQGLTGNLYTVTASLLFKVRVLDGPFRPYGFVGAGGAFVHSSYDANAMYYSYNQAGEVDFALQLGGGAEWSLGKKSRIFAQMKYESVSAGSKINAGGHITFMPIVAGFDFFL